MIYGYCRCSTNEDKQDIDRQIRDVMSLGVTDIKNIYKEYENGTKFDRLEFQKLLNIVKEGDTIISTEVSRLSRSTKDLCELIEFAKNKKIKLVLGSFVVDCTKVLDPMTEGMLKIMGVFAELERNIISQRVKSGMMNAKSKGKQIGRSTTTKEDVLNNRKFMKYYNQYKNGDTTIMEVSKLCEISRTTVYKYINLLENK